MESAKPLAIGVDVGATKIASALVASDGQLLSSRQVLTESRQGIPAVMDRIAAEVQTLAVEADFPILGIGIGTPGQVNSREGIVRNAVNLGWDEIHLVQEIGSRLSLSLPVWIQKDANASALGEYYFGAAPGCKDFVYLGVGSGLGGGIMTSGMLVTGANWNAAELGHLSLDTDGLLCSCGQRGCAETVVSGPGLLSLVRRSLAEKRLPTQLHSDHTLSTAAILAAAHSGDELALDALSTVGCHLGMVMAACVSVLNPAMIVIGGGLGLAAFDYLVPSAKCELALRTLTTSHENLKILPSQQLSSAVGAACLVWYFNEARQPIP